MLKEIRMKQYK